MPKPPAHRTVVLWALALGLVSALGTYLLTRGHHQPTRSSFHWWDWAWPGIVGWVARGLFDDRFSRRRCRRWGEHDRIGD